jgi:hypothetical protein
MNNLRTLVLLEPPVRDAVRDIAKKRQMSVSSVCRDFILKGIDLAEDEYFEKLASERISEPGWKKRCVSHEEAWAKITK